MSKKNILSIIVCGLVFFAVACTNQETNKSQQESQSSSVTTILGPISNVRSVAIQSDKTKVTLQAIETGWVSKDLADLDNTAIDELLTNLTALQGMPVKETTALKMLFEQPNTIFVLNDGTDSRKLEVVVEGPDTWVRKADETTYYQVSKVADPIKVFDPAYLQKSIELSVSEPAEIQIDAEGHSIVLNNETSMNAVEASPFISGWFLHGVYQTEFSVEYYKMDELSAALMNVKGVEGEQTVSENEASMVLALKGNNQEEMLFVGKLDKDKKRYAVTIKSNQKNYKMPAAWVEQFVFEPLAVTDNFISILPLSSIQSIEIQEAEKKTLITAKHKLITDKDNETAIQSTFYIDGEVLPEEAFRKTYQYLASLAYTTLLKNNEKPGEEASAEVKIIYHYLNAGKVETNQIRFIPMADGQQYAVDKNGIMEFITTKEDVQKALTELAALTD